MNQSQSPSRFYRLEDLPSNTLRFNGTSNEYLKQVFASAGVYNFSIPKNLFSVYHISFSQEINLN